MAFLIPSIQFFFGLPRAHFCSAIHFNAILGNLPSAILWTWPYNVSWFCSISFIIGSSNIKILNVNKRKRTTHIVLKSEWLTANSNVCKRRPVLGSERVRRRWRPFIYALSLTCLSKRRPTGIAMLWGPVEGVRVSGRDCMLAYLTFPHSAQLQSNPKQIVSFALSVWGLLVVITAFVTDARICSLVR